MNTVIVLVFFKHLTNVTNQFLFLRVFVFVYSYEFYKLDQFYFRNSNHAMFTKYPVLKYKLRPILIYKIRLWWYFMRFLFL